jgi:hypothetical protein
MRDDSSCNRWPLLDWDPLRRRSRQAQALMSCTKVVDHPDRRHPVLLYAHLARQCKATPRERVQTLAAGDVEALYGGRVDHAVALRVHLHLLDLHGRALYYVPLDDNSALLVAFDDLRNEDLGSRAVLGTAAPNAASGLAERLAHLAYVGIQAINTRQDGARAGTGADPLDQASDEGQVTVLAHLPGKTQPGTEHHCQRHPHDAPWFLDPDLVCLDFPRVPRHLDQMRVNRLVLHANPHPWIHHHPLIETERNSDSLERTLVRDQRDPKSHPLDWGGAVGSTLCRSWR